MIVRLRKLIQAWLVWHVLLVSTSVFRKNGAVDELRQLRRYFVDVEDLEVNTSSDYSKRNQKDHKDPDSRIKDATKAAETSERNFLFSYNDFPGKLSWWT